MVKSGNAASNSVQVSGGMASNGVPLSQPMKIKAHIYWKNFISTKKVTIWFRHPLFPFTACWPETNWVMAISSSVISRSKCFCTDSKVKGKLTRYFVWTIFVLRDSDVCEGVTDLSILEQRCLYGMGWGWPLLSVTDPEMLHFWH